MIRYVCVCLYNVCLYNVCLYDAIVSYVWGCWLHTHNVCSKCITNRLCGMYIYPYYM